MDLLRILLNAFTERNSRNAVGGDGDGSGAMVCSGRAAMEFTLTLI